MRAEVDATREVLGVPLGLGAVVRHGPSAVARGIALARHGAELVVQLGGVRVRVRVVVAERRLWSRDAPLVVEARGAAGDESEVRPHHAVTIELEIRAVVAEEHALVPARQEGAGARASHLRVGIANQTVHVEVPPDATQIATTVPKTLGRRVLERRRIRHRARARHEWSCERWRAPPSARPRAVSPGALGDGGRRIVKNQPLKQILCHQRNLSSLTSVS